MRIPTLRESERRINAALGAPVEEDNTPHLYVVDKTGAPVATVVMAEGATGADADRVIAAEFGAGYALTTDPTGLTTNERIAEAVAHWDGSPALIAQAEGNRKRGGDRGLRTITVEKQAAGAKAPDNLSESSHSPGLERIVSELVQDGRITTDQANKYLADSATANAARESAGETRIADSIGRPVELREGSGTRGVGKIRGFIEMNGKTYGAEFNENREVTYIYPKGQATK